MAPRPKLEEQQAGSLTFLLNPGSEADSRGLGCRLRSFRLQPCFVSTCKNIQAPGLIQASDRLGVDLGALKVVEWKRSLSAQYAKVRQQLDLTETCSLASAALRTLEELILETKSCTKSWPCLSGCAQRPRELVQLHGTHSGACAGLARVGVGCMAFGQSQ